jgi:Na+/melibiose symporter-like transporter
VNGFRYFLYFCGQLGMMGLARFFFTWILKYAAKPVVPEQFDADGVPLTLFAAAAVAWVFLAFRIFDGATDPVAGVLSDWWVRKGRQRRTLLWFSFLVPSIGMALVFWIKPDDVDLTSSFRWLVLAWGMFVFFVGYTFYAIPYWSLMDDYSAGDEKSRRVMSNLLGAGTMAATLAGFVISGDLIEHFGFRTAALWFCGPAVLLMALPYFAQPPKLEKTESKDSEEKIGLAAFKAAFSHRRFVRVLLIFAGSQMSFTVMSAAGPFIVSDLLHEKQTALKFVMGPFLLGAMACFAGVPYLSRRLGWERAVAYASIALGVVYVGTAFLGEAIVGSATVTAGIVFALGGPMAAVLLGLEGEAITACAAEKGGELTAIYFGVFNLVIKAMNGVAVVLTGLLVERATTGSTLAVRAMGIMAGGMLACGVVAYYLLKPKAEAAEEPAKPG